MSMSVLFKDFISFNKSVQLRAVGEIRGNLCQHGFLQTNFTLNDWGSNPVTLSKYVQNTYHAFMLIPIKLETLYTSFYLSLLKIYEWVDNFNFIRLISGKNKMQNGFKRNKRYGQW
jgi:hypothetical protein